MPKEEVLASFAEANKRFYANAASLHQFGRQTDALLQKTKEQLLTIVEAPNGHVIYTSGGTEANNLALLGYARKYKHRGKHIISTVIEHPAVLNTLQQLEKEGFTVDYLSVDGNGCIRLDELEQLIREDTVLVSIMHVNNELGSIQPIEQCSQVIRKYSRAIFHVDAVQSFGKIPITLTEKGPDAITISGHKIHGLKGSGALISKRHVLPEAISYGGGQEEGLRHGTVAVPNAVALARAARLAVEQMNQTKYAKWRAELIAHIAPFEEVVVLAKDGAASHILSVAFKTIRGEVAINFFQQQDIMVSTSSACASKSGEVSHVIESINIDPQYKNGVIRLSFGEMNTDEEIEQVKEVFTKFITVLRRGKTTNVE